MELCVGAYGLNRSQQDLASELALVERCRKQDADAFGKVVDAYQNRVYGFVRRMVKDPEEAADIAQEVFIRAYQGFVRFDGRSSLRTWLFRIAHNLCVDRARKVDRTPMETRIDAPEDDQVIEFPDSRWDPETIIMSDELIAAVDAALSTMSEKLRSVLILHDREDLPYDQIAQVLGLPIGTVKSRLFLARTHIQNNLAAYLEGEERRK